MNSNAFSKLKIIFINHLNNAFIKRHLNSLKIYNRKVN